MLRGVLTVGGWTMASRVLGFLRDMLIAAMAGTGSSSTPVKAARKTGRCRIRSASVKPLRSLRSAPTQKALGALEESTTARTERSAASAPVAEASSAAISVLSALCAAGRSRTSSATWSWRLIVRCW